MVVVVASKFHQIPEALWERIDLVLPIYNRSCKGGRPRLPMRNVVGGILYVLWTGCQWKAMPSQFGSGTRIHAYFQEWVTLGVFEELVATGPRRIRRPAWHRLEMAECGRGDDQIAAGWGKKPGKTRPIAANSGVKRSVLIDGRGVPLAAAVDGANVHDQTLLAPTLDGIPVSRPEPAPYRRQHLCLDKGYLGAPMDQQIRQRGDIPHVPGKAANKLRGIVAMEKLAAGKSSARTRGSTEPGGC